MSFPAHLPVSLLGLGAMVIANTAVGSTDHRQRVEVIKPEEQSSRVKVAAIDSEQFELGLYAGGLSVEDFNTNTVAGLSLSYHINSRFLAQLNHARSTVERATFEEVSEANFLSEDDRDFEYQSLLGGYNLMRGRSFLGAQRKFNSHIYLMAGAAKVSFAGEDNNGIVFGINYKTVLNDWLVVNLDFRDIVVDREFLGSSKSTHNTELTLGISALF